MKKIIFTLLFAFAIQLSYSQTTYYWVGGAGPVSFTANSSWNTQLNGSGTVRAAQAANDVLVFDGTNIGGATPATGLVTATVTSTAMGKLTLQNGADVAFTRTSSGTSTVTIGDDPSGNDFVVFAGCKFHLKGTLGSVLVLLSNDAVGTGGATTSATAMIYGDVFLEEGSTTAQNRFTTRLKGAFVFTGGSSLTTLPAYAYYPFGTTGSSTTPVASGVVFETGSSYYYGGGLSPFGSNSVSYLVDFQTGSKFYFRAVQNTNMFAGRAYGDVVIDNNTTVTADGALYKIDSFRVESGSTFITHISGSTPINGHILNNGTIRVPTADPDRNNRIVMCGTAPQNIRGTGTFTLADFIVSNASNVKLFKSLQVDTTTVIFGTLAPNGNAIAGPAAIIKAPATITTTGNVNVDSFLVKTVASFIGVEVGMSVTGTGIPAGTVITNTSSANGTITLSKPVTGTVLYAGTAISMTIFNGQGVLPIKFGDVSAVLQNAQVKVSWKILTEDNVSRYVIERSQDARQFTEIGTVSVNRSRVYSFIDVNPLSGTGYYRIKAISNDGEVKYSAVLKVNNAKGNAEFAVYPNPVKNGNINIQLSNLSKGSYTLNLYNNLGQTTFSKVLSFDGGSLNQSITLPASVKAGVYRLALIGADATLNQTVVVQ